MSVDILPSCSVAFDAERLEIIDKSVVNRRRSSKSKYESTYVRNTVAMAVIHRLHKWCCQLFWLTIVCVIGCYGELNTNRHKTLQDVRRSLANGGQRRCKTVSDLEMQLLRHLTCPQAAIHVPLRPVSQKRRQLSRPPSPQLFDICEDDEPLD